MKYHNQKDTSLKRRFAVWRKDWRYGVNGKILSTFQGDRSLVAELLKSDEGLYVVSTYREHKMRKYSNRFACYDMVVFGNKIAAVNHYKKVQEEF